MDLTFPLQKMRAENGEPITYFHLIDSAFHDSGEFAVNDALHRKHTFEFQGQYQCFCGELKNRVYQRNFCYDCFFKLPQASQSIFKPELSQAHLGIFERDAEWEQKVHVQPHFVYLAMTGGEVKVGVTRSNQIPTRWIDQGATAGLIIAEAPHRHAAGVIEVALKARVNDKTNWRRMLTTGSQDDTSILLEKRAELLPLIPEDHQLYSTVEYEPLSLVFPVEAYPTKIKSLNLEKTPQFSGVLIGVKGQYLIFEDGVVFNIRSNEGKIVRWQID